MKKALMIAKGFIFGMMLQLAVGPVCIFIFQAASQKGFRSAESGVLGVVLVDTVFIAAAALGIASVIKTENLTNVLKWTGVMVMLAFGLNLMLGSFGISLLPGFSGTGPQNTNHTFGFALVLTAGNPLTILFWGGVFSLKISQEQMKKAAIYLFGLGALLAGLCFLTFIAMLGSLLHSFVTPFAAKLLNLMAGLAISGYALKMLLKKS